MGKLKTHLTLSFTIICLMILSFNAYSQSKQQKNSILLPVRIKDKWGYINEKGKIVIKPNFWSTGDFSEGFAIVRDEDRWFYYIDENGKPINNGKKYRFADDFSEGLAAVQENRDSKIGFIDSSGKLVIEPKFDSFTGKIIGSFKDDLNYVYLDGKIGFIDKTGNFVIKPIFDGDATLNATPFSENLATIRQNGKYGFIDKTGEIKIVPQFETVSPFSEGFAAISFDRLKFGYIDKSGKIVIEPKFDWAYSFSEGLAAVNIGMAWHGHQKSGGKYGFIDKTGRVVIDVIFDAVNPFSEGLAPVLVDGKWGFIDKTGTIQIQPQFDWVEIFSQGLSRVTVKGKIGYINKSGKYIWKPS